MTRENTVISIIGQKGSGKSYLTKQILTEFPRVFILDNTQEYARAEIVEGFNDCVARIVKASREKRFTISLRAETTDQDIALLRLIETVPYVLVVIEEASRYVSSARLPDAIAKLIRFGRHKCISQIYLARRATELHRDLTANSDVIITFHQHEPRDLLYLREFMGEKVGDKGIKARKLSKYRFIAWGKKSKAPRIVISRLQSQ